MSAEDSISVREFSDLKQDVNQLRGEMQNLLVELKQTQTIIRDYNGLRESVEVQKRLAVENGKRLTSLEKTVGKHDEILETITIKKKFLGSVWANATLLASLGISAISLYWNYVQWRLTHIGK